MSTSKSLTAFDDWLIDPTSFRTKVEWNKNRVLLTNGIASREFVLKPGVATISVKHLPTSENLIRAIRPEAQITINGKKYQIGGLTGQPNQAFLKSEWVSKMKADPNGFQLSDFKITEPEPRISWKKLRHHNKDLAWPPKGKQIRFVYDHSDHPNIFVTVHYELYDGVPCFCKWLSVSNRSKKPITIDRLDTEILAVVEKSNWVEARDGVDVPRCDSIHVETDFAFGGFNHQNANRHVVHWEVDPQYKTQVNYLRKTPCLLRVSPTYGPAQTVAPRETFKSFHTFELIHGSISEERKNLALRKMYRTIAPWTTENPIMLHLKASDESTVRRAIDQCKDVGFEMVILSFGSGFNIEDRSVKNITQWKKLAEYAKQQGIEIGGYSLLSSRRVGGGNDIVPPNGVKLTHGNCPALTSEWGQKYFKTLSDFFEQTGFSLLEHDGSYPGDVDTTARPPFQKGEADSRWAQWKVISRYYNACRAKGIYLNVPDYYFLSGSNKCGMGYREVNWSLPRDHQVIHTRQNIFDGTKTKTPSMGWMFVPLTQYHGGGAAATVEPLNEHLDHYERMMAGNFGAGVQACYRGPRIFDTDKTRDRVAAWVAWFKKHRAILESDIIHSSSRRSDGRGLDWLLHANSSLNECGMLVVHNPTGQELTREIPLNLYYTGIEDSAIFKPCPIGIGLGNVESITQPSKTGTVQVVKLDRQFRCKLSVKVPANGVQAFVIEKRR